MASKDIKGLFLAHQRELQAYLTRKLRNADTAADLTQETFLRFAERKQGDGAPAITHERSYLYRTARNLALDYLRRERGRQTDICDTALNSAVDDAPSPEQIVSDRDDLAAVRAAILELPARTRQIFVLTRIKGLTYREAAIKLQISDSSVQKHLAKATKHVMERLRQPHGPINKPQPSITDSRPSRRHTHGNSLRPSTPTKNLTKRRDHIKR